MTFTMWHSKTVYSVVMASSVPESSNTVATGETLYSIPTLCSSRDYVGVSVVLEYNLFKVGFALIIAHYAHE